MPARLLAYGGTSFSERRRIGQWPAIPEATLRDSYGLTSTGWCFGFGILERQPFLIFRQRQNVENRGGYPFSLLLDPGEEVWPRFAWNPAAVAVVMMREAPEALFRSPENCSADTLERHMAALPGLAMASAGPTPLSYAVAGSALVSEPVGYPERPPVEEVAGALAGLPVCFRAGTGWLVGGALAHGRALGAMLVLDSVGTADICDAGRSLLSAWEPARGNSLVRSREAQPLWKWPEPADDLLNAVMLLRDIQGSAEADDLLLERADKSRALDSEIQEAVEALFTRGSGPLGLRASTRLIRPALAGQRGLSAALMPRLDRDTLNAELRKFGAPPKAVPETLPLPEQFRLGLWTHYLEGLTSDVAKNLAAAFGQAGKHSELVRRALAALPGSDESLLAWNIFRQDHELWAQMETTLRNEALRRFTRHVEGSAEAYLILGQDPGGVAANEALTRDEDAIRLVAEVKALERERPNEAADWINALKKSPLRKRLPKAAPARVPKAQPAEASEELRRVLFESEPDDVDERCNRLGQPAARVSLDDSSTGCEQFAKAFHGKYGSLGCVMSWISDESQERLLECFASSERWNLSAFAAEHVKHAINNKVSRSQYTAALARFLLKNPKMLKQIADQLGFLKSEFEPKLRTLAKDKGRS